MEIISFTGKSGTGKSYQATKLCRKYGIEAIIDDGLLICNNSIVAGSSAKKCASKAAAMRTALFNYEAQKNEVVKKLNELKPEKLLIIGTSDRMADWITDALGLHRADKRIYIEDVTTEEQREIANISRNIRGEHVIPAPMMQLKRDFSGYFINPVRLFRNINLYGNQPQSDRTIVRPTFMYYGDFNISENVLGDIIKLTASKYDDKIKVLNFFNNSNTSNLNIVVQIKIWQIPGIVDRCITFQKAIKMVIEKMTAFSVSNVNIEIKDVYIENKNIRSRKSLRYSKRKIEGKI